MDPFSSISSDPDTVSDLLRPADLRFDRSPVLVPETPSPQFGKRRQPCRAEESGRGSEGVAVRHSSKRRRLLTGSDVMSCHLKSPLSEECLSECLAQQPGAAESGLASRGSQRASNSSLSFLTSEEKEWIHDDCLGPQPATEIVISDGDEEDVRSAQLEEDEAMARHLQEQFDREEQGSRHFLLHHQHHLQPRHGHADPLADIMAAVQEGLIGHRRGGGRGRRSRHQDRAMEQLIDGFPGDDYEALLQLEEHQGPVVSRQLLTEAQIQMFPTRMYLSHSARQTQCQICFCDYNEGEELRVLPCFHDYHVQCIDRWFKEDVTCPICRVNMADDSLGVQ